MNRRRNHMPLLVLLGVAALVAQHPLSFAAAEERVGHEVSGMVIIPGTASTVVKLHTSDGKELQAFPELDGSFTFRDVPPGSHMLQPFCTTLYYPEVRVDVSARAGVVRALIQGNQQRSMVVSLPLVLRPIGEVQYFERRKPVDVWSLLKSPYGLMVAASLFIIFVLPKMKLDPEDYKEMQPQLKGSSGSAASGGGAAPKPIAGSGRL